ncbi:MAG: phosphotransferase [Victivallales bacterium]|nr:phosphotransferase [Victivallales bacterium]
MNAMLKINCPNCGHKLDVTSMPSLSMQVCPACGKDFMVPKWFLKSILLEEPIWREESKSIYRALEPALDRESCVKIYRGMEDMEGMLSSVRKQAQIAHPGVAAIYSCGQCDEGAYVNTQYLRPHPWTGTTQATDEELRTLAVKLCDALAAADAVGLVHGDLCPRNVMENADGALVVVDFGIATARGTAEELYVAPERRQGGAATRAGDIFSLGLMLYQFATWQLPGGENRLAWLEGGVPPEPPHALNPQISKKASDLILSMISLRAEERPVDYSVIRNALLAKEPKKVLRNVPVREQKVAKPSRGICGPVFVVVLLAALAGGYWFWLKKKASMETETATEKGAPSEVVAGTRSGETSPQASSATMESTPEFQLSPELAAMRPKPDDLNFAKTKKQNQAYLKALPEELRKIEVERLRILGSMLDTLSFSMRAIPYARNDRKIMLVNGKTIQGTLPFPPRNGKIQIRPEGKEAYQIPFGDLSIETIVDMFQFYAEERQNRTNNLRAERNDIAEAYFRTAILADWYDLPDVARENAKNAWKFRSDRRWELKKFGLPYVFPLEEE